MMASKHTYLPWVLFIYFFNTYLLPHGLVFSALLTPVLLYWLWKNGARQSLWIPPLVVVFISLLHLRLGAQLSDLTLSTGLFITAYYFGLTLWYWIGQGHLRAFHFNSILKWNALFVILALICLPFEVGRAMLWYEVPISPGVSSFPRLKLFTYEASYYAFLFTPIFLYYFWRLMLHKTKRWLLLSIGIGLPLLLAMSFGVIGAILLSFMIVSLAYPEHLLKYTNVKRALLYGTGVAVMVAIVTFLIFPDNPLFQRTENILEGADTSARGRLIESFKFAFDLASNHNLWIGVGLGQIKVFAHDLIINYYQYEGDYMDIVRIPNSVAEWLSTYGLFGMAFKLSLEVFWFFRFKVYRNYFNLTLFLVVFIYQFTGSYIVSTAEIMIWVVAFRSRFPSFDVSIPKQIDS